MKSLSKQNKIIFFVFAALFVLLICDKIYNMFNSLIIVNLDGKSQPAPITPQMIIYVLGYCIVSVLILLCMSVLNGKKTATAIIACVSILMALNTAVQLFYIVKSVTIEPSYIITILTYLIKPTAYTLLYIALAICALNGFKNKIIIIISCAVILIVFLISLKIPDTFSEFIGHLTHNYSVGYLLDDIKYFINTCFQNVLQLIIPASLLFYALFFNTPCIIDSKKRKSIK